MPSTCDQLVCAVCYIHIYIRWFETSLQEKYVGSKVDNKVGGGTKVSPSLLGEFTPIHCPHPYNSKGNIIYSDRDGQQHKLHDNIDYIFVDNRQHRSTNDIVACWT